MLGGEVALETLTDLVGEELTLGVQYAKSKSCALQPVFAHPDRQEGLIVFYVHLCELCVSRCLQPSESAIISLLGQSSQLAGPPPYP